MFDTLSLNSLEETLFENVFINRINYSSRLAIEAIVNLHIQRM